MHKWKTLSSVAVLSLLSACSGNSSNSSEMVNGEILATITPAAPPPPPLPPPLYDDKEGDVYLYTSAVSENDKKEGKATGSVVGFKYLGKQEDIFRIGLLDESDKVIGSAECANPCSVIKYKNRGMKQRVAFSEDSVIGSVFLDAFRGYLEPVKTRNEQPVVPKAIEPELAEDTN